MDEKVVMDRLDEILTFVPDLAPYVHQMDALKMAECVPAMFPCRPRPYLGDPSVSHLEPARALSRALLVVSASSTHSVGQGHHTIRCAVALAPTLLK